MRNFLVAVLIALGVVGGAGIASGTDTPVVLADGGDN